MENILILLQARALEMSLYEAEIEEKRKKLQDRYDKAKKEFDHKNLIEAHEGLYLLKHDKNEPHVSKILESYYEGLIFKIKARNNFKNYDGPVEEAMMAEAMKCLKASGHNYKEGKGMTVESYLSLIIQQAFVRKIQKAKVGRKKNDFSY